MTQPVQLVAEQHALWDRLKAEEGTAFFTCLDMQGEPHLWCETHLSSKQDVLRFAVINGAWMGRLTKAEDGIWLHVEKYPEHSGPTVLAEWSDPPDPKYNARRTAQEARQADDDEIPF